MVAKKTPAGREYEVTGRKFIWHADVDDGEEPFDIEIPLRVKMRVFRSMLGEELTAANMMAFLEMIVPNQSEKLDELDVHDFQACFTTWNGEYEQLNGVSVGESQGSSS